MTVFKSWLCFVGVSMIAVSCASHLTKFEPRASTIDLYQSSPLLISVSPREPNIGLVSLPQLGNGSVYRQAILFYSTTDGRHDSLAMMMVSTGTPSADPAVTARFIIPAGTDQSSMRIGLEHGNRFIIYPAKMQLDVSEPLVLSAFIQRANTLGSRPGDPVQTSDLYVIGVDATRFRAVEGEYLPSSEDLRVIIRQGLKIMWQSNSGMSYLTVITPVRPERPGEHSLYSLEWAGTDIYGMPLAPGEYTADIIIPAKPAPYQTQVTFTWPLSKK